MIVAENRVDTDSEARLRPFIFVTDQFAPKEIHDAVWQTCMSKRWYFGNRSNEDNAVPFWKMDLDDDPATSALWQHAKPLCEAKVGRGLQVLRQYANGHTYGLGGAIHRDDKRDGSYTLLYYPMPRWHQGWDGETIYQDRKGEVVLAVKPVPNRAILFDSRIPHVGRAPSRAYAGLRATVAYKLFAE